MKTAATVKAAAHAVRTVQRRRTSVATADERDDLAVEEPLEIRVEGRVFLAPLAPGNLQIHWPEGNHLIRRGVEDRGGGVPDYNAHVRIERLAEKSTVI